MIRPKVGLLCLVLAVLFTLGHGLRTCAAREVTNVALNFLLDLPEGWVDENAKGSWEKDGIRWSAIHRLEKLADGTPAQGQGGRATLSVIEAPKGKTLAELAADPAQRAFLMNHFGKQEGWPPVESEETKVVVIESELTEVPAVLLKAKGQALNLAEVDASSCRANMLVTLAGGKLYRLKLLAWPTPEDAEEIRSELDVIEVSFTLTGLKKEAVKADPSGGGGNGGGPKQPETEKVVGDSDKEFMIQDLFVVEGWRVKKPKKLATQTVDKVKNPNLRVQLGNNDTMGDCTLQFMVYANQGFDAHGNPMSVPDLRKWLTTSWWQLILSTFPMGPLATHPWPKGKGADFLAAPIMTPEEEKVIAAEPKDRAKSDIDEDAVLRMKKVPFVEEVEKAAFGKLKCQAAYRGVIKGNAKGTAKIFLRYGWKTEKYTYFLYIQFGRDGLKRYEAPVKEFLESLEITK